jgi:hypothetical protein
MLRLPTRRHQRRRLLQMILQLLLLRLMRLHPQMRLQLLPQIRSM